jgi:hypothetical protein
MYIYTHLPPPTTRPPPLQVIFNGDCYDAAEQAGMKARGVCHIESTVEALQQVRDCAVCVSAPAACAVRVLCVCGTAGRL